MRIMLTAEQYNQGLTILEQSKYTIEYDKTSMFVMICSQLAAYLLQHEYANDLTEEQKKILEQLANK